MRVLAFDPFVSAERYRELGVEKADERRGHLRAGRLHHDPPAEDAGDRRLPRRRRVREDARRRARPQRRARRADRRSGAEGRRSTRARSPAPRSTCSRREPMTEHPLFGYPNVVVTPHLGASTAEATDRAGYQSAEQVVAALTGGVVSTAVNIPAIGAEDMEMLGPVPAARHAARAARDGARRGQLGRAHRGRVPRPDRRLRHAPARRSR